MLHHDGVLAMAAAVAVVMAFALSAFLVVGDEADSGAPLKDAYSFTEKGARKRAERLGFAEVQNLKKGEDGIWRGHAVQQGEPVEIAIDRSGNVATSSPRNGD